MVTVSGIVKEVKASQPSKACAPISVISPSNITVVSFLHEDNIPSGTTVNCFGRVNDTNPQLEKENFPISVREEGRLISERTPQPAKALSPIVLTPSGVLILFRLMQ